MFVTPALWGGLRRYASLRYASLRFASLRCASLRYASLRYATLRFATLRYATLRSCIESPQLAEEERGEAAKPPPRSDGKPGKGEFQSGLQPAL